MSYSTLVDDDIETLLVSPQAARTSIQTPGSPRTSPLSPTTIIAVDDGNWRRELGVLTRLAVPVIITYLLEYLPTLITIIFIGHYHGKENLDAAALASAFSNVTGLSIGLGLATALDTLCSQAYGAKQPQLMGIFLQRGVYVISLAFIPVAIVNVLSDRILAAVGQPGDVAQLAGVFCRLLLPGLPAMFLYDMLRKVLQAQNVVQPMLWVAVLCNVFTAAGTYLFMYPLGMGAKGAFIARSITAWLFPLFLLAYLNWTGLVREWWGGLHRQAFAGWGDFIALAVPGLLMMVFEWWSFEILAIMAWRLPDNKTMLGAQSILFTIGSLVFMTYLGISVSASVRVGNTLGAGQPRNARTVTVVSYVLGVLSALGTAGLLIGLHDHLPRLMSSDPDIVRVASRALFVLGAYQIFDSLNAVSMGVFRGSGRQTLGAIVNGVAYNVAGLPLAWVFAFQLHYGVRGLWWGLTVALAGASMFSSTVILRTDWRAQVVRAQERLDAEDERGDAGQAKPLL